MATSTRALLGFMLSISFLACRDSLTRDNSRPHSESVTGQVHAADEPRGLLLREGLVRWEASLKETTGFVEQNMRPRTLLQFGRVTQPPEGFHCERTNTAGIIRCPLACCVDLGEKDTLHFATLWFYNDRLYSYDVTFNSGLFSSLLVTLEERFGSPSKETQESRTDMVSALAFGGGINSYTASSRRWDVGNTLILLTDRGAEGKPLVGDIDVEYLPIEGLIPAKKTEPESRAKLPF